ncbi:hypothetical protein ACFV0O_01245 [Kitasatospora sp. NPDC059577]|uniref:hypothetical protein n=1 Tax=Kitasatospora sp. NPDC059577 TaxID=3346873 RepID=UPI0036CCBAE9
MSHASQKPEPPRAPLAAARAHTAELLRLPNVTGVGVAYKVVAGRRTETVGVTVNVSRKEPPTHLSRLQRVPGELTVNGETVRTDVVETAMPRFCAGPVDFAEYRPVPGGCMIESMVPMLGTVAGVFYDRQWPYDAVLLTNNHVLCDPDRLFELPPDTRVLQPWAGGVFPAEFIGRSRRIVPFYRAPLGSENAFECTVDAGIVALDPPVRPQFSVLEIPGKHPFVVLPPSLGERVLRRGITTRLQSGTVEAIGVTQQMQSATGKIVLLGVGNTLFQIRSDPGDPAAQEGDSGSIVLDSTATRGLVGATDFALGGRTWAYDMLTVMAVLDIDTACKGSKRDLIRRMALTHPETTASLKSFVDMHTEKFERFSAEYLTPRREGRLAGALGTLLEGASGQAIAEAQLTDEDFAGLLTRTIGPWLVRPTAFDMLEYRLPDDFAPSLRAAFTRLSDLRPEAVDTHWWDDAFRDVGGRSMREVLDRRVQAPAAPATDRVGPYAWSSSGTVASVSQQI